MISIEHFTNIQLLLYLQLYTDIGTSDSNIDLYH